MAMAGERGRLNDGVKQRIVGALVLAALAVIFLPTLFDREGARYIDITSQIPTAPDIQPIEIAEPQPVADAPPAPEPQEIFQPQVVNSQSAAGQAQPTTAPAETAAELTAEASPVLDPQGLPIAWVVQVAAYRDAKSAERLRAQLMDEGYKAYTRAVTTDKGQMLRVFVGPKVNRADALAVKQELDRLLKTQTLVLRFKA
jgi:DedD protein